jgi:hypothetical protein
MGRIKPKLKICKQCNKEFLGRDNKLYCSQECKRKAFQPTQNKWRKNNKYHLIYYERNPKVNCEKSKRHRQTDKGKLTMLKCNERRRKKNITLTGTPNDFLSNEELKIIDDRDIVCVYCKNEFIINNTKKKPTYDHLDFNKRLSLTNAVKCCWSCNSSKRNVSIEKIPEWIKRKRFNPSPIVMELLKKKLH